MALGHGIEWADTVKILRRPRLQPGAFSLVSDGGTALKLEPGEIAALPRLLIHLP